MPTKCITLVRGRRLRLTRLDDCARPVYAGDSSITNMGWVSITATANTSETDEILVRGADGSILLREPSVASLVGYTLALKAVGGAAVLPRLTSPMHARTVSCAGQVRLPS